MPEDHSFTVADFKHLLLGHLKHESETAWYLLLSVGDFILSYVLFTGGTVNGQSAAEANPVAAWFLNHYGLLKGLLGYKLTVVVFVCLVVQLISMKQERLGRLILWLGIALTAYVDIYSLKLLFGVR